MRRLALLALLAALILPSSASATFPGANGKIAFARGGDIWTMNPDGTAQVNLTNSVAPEYAPDWSPDGSRIAFAVARTSSEQPRSMIFVMNANGSNRTYVGNNVTPDDVPQWSPDGSEIAFFINNAIYVMASDNSSRRYVGSTLGDLRELDWSPDGELISVHVDCGRQAIGHYIGTVSAAGGQVEPLTSATGCETDIDKPYVDIGGEWSPDAQRVLFHRERVTGPDPTSLYSLRRDGTGLTPISTVPPEGGIFPGAWSPDGTKVAYVAYDIHDAANSPRGSSS